MTAPRLALTAAAALLLLAGCTPSTPAPADDTPTPSAPAVVSLSDLEFSIDSPETLDALQTARTDLETQYADYTGACTAADAASGDQGDCLEGILTTLQKVNGVKTVFDFSPWSAEDYASGDYSGLTALQPTVDAIQAASDNGSDVIDHCYYVPGGEGCEAEVQGFLDLTKAAIDAMQTWER
ncbi:MAG: hypothetical protein ACTHKX_03400 [Pseudolysinimonas sp.]